MYDVVIIGAGISGSSIARELMRYQLKVLVLEKESDVCEGSTKANSGIIHAGFDSEPGTKKAYYNRLGNLRYQQLEEELGLKIVHNGALVLCFDESQRPALDNLLKKAVSNQIEGCVILEKNAILELEPTISQDVVCALYAPTSALCDSFQVNQAFAENAFENGAEFRFNTAVISLEHPSEFIIQTTQGKFTSRLVINAAGVYGDDIARLLSQKPYTITPRRGEYYLLDKQSKPTVTHTIFQLPNENGKGILVAPTVSNNLIIGPNAHEVASKNETETTAAGLHEVLHRAHLSVPSLSVSTVITTFAGIRASESSHDFIIEESPDCPGFFQVIGIESPGLTSAPAIALDVVKWVRERLHPEENPAYNPQRDRPPVLAESSDEEKQQLWQKNPDYGQIICRCESVSKAEILQAIQCHPGATTLDGLKRRVRAGSGRCQGGFCSGHCLELLAEYTHRPIDTITKSGPGSEVLCHPQGGENHEYR